MKFSLPRPAVALLLAGLLAVPASSALGSRHTQPTPARVGNQVRITADTYGRVWTVTRRWESDCLIDNGTEQQIIPVAELAAAR